MMASRIAEWSLWIAETAFIIGVFVAMICLGTMQLAAGRFFLPWEMNRLVEGHKLRFPNSVVYKIFSISAICAAVFAGLGLAAVLWISFGSR